MEKEVGNNLVEIGAYIPIADFYAGKSLFITGSTGFVGKAIIEKLLYSCPKIKQIYTLIREKNDVSVADRMQQIVDKPLFSRIKEERPEDLRKIVPVVGDITYPDLKLSVEVKRTLLQEVSVVIHSAATVKFNEQLRTALKVNVEGTRHVLELSRLMENIKAFVYISTAYSNTDRQIIDEVLYPPPAKLDDVYKFLELYGDDEQKTIELLNGRPNTYTYTKALAEALIAESHGNVPAVIIRPSAVTPSIREPLEGWIDNWFGATGIVIAVSKGVCRAVFGHADNLLDLIPLDYVCNLTLIAAARCTGSKEVAVYNSCTSYCNPITLGEIFRLFCKESVIHKFNELPHPCVIYSNRKWIVKSISWFQLILAYVADSCRRIKGKNPRYFEMQPQTNFVRELVEYFSSHSWVIRDGSARALAGSLCARDRQLFPYDPALIDWTKYITVYFMGIQKYLFNNSTLCPQSKL